MKICGFCDAQNEDWMEICQQCGNPLEKNAKVVDTSSDFFGGSNTSVNENKDLKLIILVLSVILAILLIYTIFTLT